MRDERVIKPSVNYSANNPVLPATLTVPKGFVNYHAYSVKN